MEQLAGIPQLPLVLGVSTTAMDLRAQPATSYSAVTGIPNAASSTIAYTYGLDAQIQTIFLNFLLMRPGAVQIHH